MSDITLHSAVMAALAENPLVRADEIAAEVRDGDVVLRGTVGSLVQKAESARTTRGVPGVRRVDDQLGVHPVGIDGRADADTKAAILDDLIADDRVHAGDIDVDVDDGEVTLRGIVEHADQRDTAERIVLGVPGVKSVENKLGVLTQVSADEIAERLTNALGIEAVIGAERVMVRVHDGDVTLSGLVRSRAHHDAALTVARNSPGVTRVHDELIVDERR
jgi:osmotically-inducible protein OsmY